VASAATATGPAAIAQKYADTGGSSGPLGAATDAVSCTLGNGGCVQHFARGRIVWSALTGAHTMTDAAVTAAWDAAGGGSAGYPTVDTFCGLVDAGCGQHFDDPATGGTAWSVYRSAHTAAVVVPLDVRQAWSAVGWERGPLGYPTAAVECGYANGGCLQRFQTGIVYSHQFWGAQPSAVWGAIQAKWGTTGWESGALGYPVGNPICGLRNGGCGQHFERGSIYTSPAGTFVVRPEVQDRWAAQGWENGTLGYPVGDTFCGLVDVGCGQHFQGGSVYWSLSTGAHVVHPAARTVWSATGWERGPLQYPTGEQFGGLRNGGWGQQFQNGSIYSSAAGTFDVVGAVKNRWAAQGWENGPLGYPVTSTYCGLRRGGCGQHFQGGDVYSGPQGTFLVADGGWHGAIQQAWAATGWENGSLGYPVTDTFCGLRDGGCGQHFEGTGVEASVYVSPASGGRGVVVGPVFRDRWGGTGWENGRLGYPVGPQYQIPGGWAQPFEHGVLKVVNGIYNY
jgi:uncharacterized protein with LGFP repeats